MLGRLNHPVSRNFLNLLSKRASAMDLLLQQNQQAEDMIKNLKDEFDTCLTAADEERCIKERKQIERLDVENSKLRAHAASLKNDLLYLELQRGYKAISVPIVTKSREPWFAPGKPQECRTSELTSPNKTSKPPTAQENQMKVKKEVQKNKEKVAGESKGKRKDNAGDERPVDVSRLNMKIGKIVNVKKHPDADSLYVEEVDVGEGKNRTIVSGLVKHVSMENLQDRLAIFMLNLKPAKMRGILSEGMIMCASTPVKVEVLELPSGAQVGDCITFNGYPGEPDMQLNPKKKVWEQIQPDLRVNADGVPCYRSTPFTIDGKGQCKAPSLTNCQIK